MTEKIIIRGREVPVTADYQEKLGTFMMVKYIDLGAPGAQIQGRDSSKYIQNGDQVEWKGKQYVITGIEMFKSVWITDCAIRIEEVKPTEQ